MPWSGATERAVLLAAAGAASAALGCARPSQPPGAAEETRPPAVRSLSPAMDSVVEGMDGRARVQFDEPIRAGSGLGRELRASPAYRYRVTVGHSEVSIRPEGGWRPGAVYVLELPEGITDLLNNRRSEPVRMVFSTGPPIAPTRVRARLFDRVTGEELTDGRLLFLSARTDSPRTAADTVPYTSQADTAGRYVLRHLPPGEYWAYGFLDRNRNRRLDRRIEPYDSARVSLGSDSAEASVTLSAMEPDSTPPRLGRAETPDSVTVRLGFDDHLRPGQPLPGLVVRRGPGGRRLPVREATVLTAGDTVPARPSPGASDTAATDTAAADTAGSEAGAADTAGAPPGDTADPRADTAVDSFRTRTGTGAAEQAPPDTATADRPPRPTRLLRIRLEEPMAVGDTIRVRIDAVRNLWDLSSAADTAFAFVPPPDSARADTVSDAAPDTARANTLPGAAADTTPRPPVGTRRGRRAGSGREHRSPRPAAGAPGRGPAAGDGGRRPLEGTLGAGGGGRGAP